MFHYLIYHLLLPTVPIGININKCSSIYNWFIFDNQPCWIWHNYTQYQTANQRIIRELFLIPRLSFSDSYMILLGLVSDILFQQILYIFFYQFCVVLNIFSIYLQILNQIMYLDKKKITPISGVYLALCLYFSSNLYSYIAIVIAYKYDQCWNLVLQLIQFYLNLACICLIILNFCWLKFITYFYINLFLRFNVYMQD